MGLDIRDFWKKLFWPVEYTHWTLSRDIILSIKKLQPIDYLRISLLPVNRGIWEVKLTR